MWMKRVTGWRLVDVHSKDWKLLLHNIIQSHHVRPAHQQLWPFLIGCGRYKKKKKSWWRWALDLSSTCRFWALGDAQFCPPGCWMMDEQETRWRRSARCFNFGCSAQRRRSRKLLRSDSWRQQLGSSSSVLCEAFGSSVSRCDVAKGKTTTQSFTL